MLGAPYYHPLAPLAPRLLAQLYRTMQPLARDIPRQALLLLCLLVCVAWLNAVSAFAQGIITTVAGNGERGFWGNGGQATNTPLNLRPYTGGVAVDAAGNLYIADTGSHRVYKLSPDGRRLTVAGSDCWVCTVDEQLAGDPRAGFSGDGGQAFNALLNSPSGLGVDGAGNLFIVDTGNHRIRKISPDGIITTVAGNGLRGFSGDGGPAINASLNLATWWGPTTYSGNVAVDGTGTLYIADTGNGRIRKVTPDGTITSVAYFADPFSVAVDLAGNLYIAENTPHLVGGVHKITPGGIITTIAACRNEPVPGFGSFGDGGLATHAWLLFCTGVAVDATGNVYIADSGAQRIRKVDPEGKITTVAGSGNPVFTPPDPILGEGGGYDVQGGFSGDGGLSTNAQMNTPWGVAVDAAGNIFIADSLNNRIRKVRAEDSGPAQRTFTNPIRIADGFSTDPIEPATPYPSEIAVVGLSGSVTKVTVTLTNLNFGDPRSADLLLVGPNGQGVILMSDAAGDETGHIINKTLTFDDAALAPLPSDGSLRSGTYKPTNFDVEQDFFPPPAPGGPYGTTLSAFNGTNPNGTWNLYMVDDVPDNPFDHFGPDVVISGGWSITITASPQSPSVNPIDDAQFFIRQHYLDFFNRHADDLGLAFWTNEITPCGFDPQCIESKRINVSAAFFLSIEFQQTGYLVYRMYKAAYGDMPGTPVPLTRQEFLPDTQQVGQGVVVGASGWDQQLETNKNAFANQFVARSRFTTAFPQAMTAEQFVDALNANAGGVLSQGERNQLVSELASGAKTRAQVLRSVAEDADLARQEFNKAFVLMQYFGYLRRNPNDAPDTNFVGYDFWLDKLNQFNGNYVAAEMVKAFISSTEYRQRFGQP